jgi:hypothetical protein
LEPVSVERNLRAGVCELITVSTELRVKPTWANQLPRTWDPEAPLF